MANRITFYPAALPSADPLVLDAAAGSTLRLLRLGGIAPLTVQPSSTKGLSQEGETALDVVIPPRIVSAEGYVPAANFSDLWAARSAIARAMVNIPVRFGSQLNLGRLLIERPDAADREIYGLPLSSVFERIPNTTRALLDFEWHCPYPYFLPTSDTESDEIAVDASETIPNNGDVDAPFVARIDGPATEVTLTNLTSGELFTVTVILTAGQWLEVDTTPGVKTVRKFTSVGVWENAISGLSLADGRLFQLLPANNSIKLEAVGDDVNTVATLTFRPRYSAL